METAAALAGNEVVIVMLFQEVFDLLCKEGEKFFGCFSNHQFSRDGYFRLREREV